MQRTIRARLSNGNAVVMGFEMFSCTDSRCKDSQTISTSK
jgi:hypothetical protein